MRKGTGRVDKWKFLTAMKLGEVYTVDNPAVNGVGKSGTQKYRDVTAAIWALHLAYASWRWVQRLRDDKIDIILVKTDVGQIEPPISSALKGRHIHPKIPAGPSEEGLLRQKLRGRKHAQEVRLERKTFVPLATSLKQDLIEHERNGVIKALNVKPKLSGQEYLIRMVRAHAAGNEIEVLIGSKWILDPNPTFLDEPFNYRIKPEPLKEMFAVLTRDGKGIVRSALTRKELGQADPECVVHYREIPKEEEEDVA